MMMQSRRTLLRLVFGCVAAGAGPAAMAVVAPGSAAAAASAARSEGLPSAAEIVQRNIAARGGADAWKRTYTMVWTGHVESTGARALNSPFVLEKMRPDRSRFEVATQGQTAVRIYDGSNGWKLIPSPAGRPDLRPYTPDELRFSHDAQSIEGPLMNYVNQHAAIEVVGAGDVQGRRAYILQVRPPEGEMHRVWVDAETYFELRQDRSVRNVAGQLGMATIYFRDYREFQGLQVPTTIETQSPDGKSVNRLVVEKVLVNPTLDLHAFDKPSTTGAGHRGVLVDMRSAAAPPAKQP